MKAILELAADGKPYTADQIRDGLATKLGVTPELQIILFELNSALTKWKNYVAHGLSWHSRAPEAHTLGGDGHYQLTELGKIMASQVVAQTARQEPQLTVKRA